MRIKKIKNMSLSKQLIIVTLIALGICSLALGIILPKILKPFYEKSVYNYLRQPSNYIGPNTNKMSDDISFIIITKGGAIYISGNLNEMIPGITSSEIIEKADKEQGKFDINGTTYYYLWGETKGQRNLIITDRTQIREQEESLLGIIFPTMIATITITILLLVTWSQYILNKIKKIDKKTKALITGEKIEGNEFIIDDELNELSSTIDEVDRELKEKDEYKNMMFQNLSHELKTPISVIQSYIEGIEDDVVDKDEAIKIISEETKVLSNQVKTILQINKIDFMKDSKKYENSKTNLKNVINEVIEKHKMIREDIEYAVNFEKEEEDNIFNGTEEMWRAVFDNILGNFVRYAKNKVEITVKKDEIVLFNDGEKLNNEMIEKIFLPYVKGNKGQTGLGLSIVKKTVNLFGYDIKAKNVEAGVEFIIK